MSEGSLSDASSTVLLKTKPLILDALFPITVLQPAALNAAGHSAIISTLTAPPLPPLGDPSQSPRRREAAAATPISPFQTVQQQQQQHSTPVPTPPAAANFSLPTQSQSSSPVASIMTSNAAGVPFSLGRNLFFHSPQEIEPPRYSHRSGRCLSELESLHQKHESEFKLLVPAIGNAIKNTMDAHAERIRLLQVTQSERSRHGGLHGSNAQQQQHTPLAPLPPSGAAASSPQQHAASIGSPTTPNAAGGLSTREGSGAECSSSTSATGGSAVSISTSSDEYDERLTFYDTVAAPSVTVQAYVKRIADFTYVSPATLLASVILMDRMLTKYAALHLTPQNVFKLFFVAVRVASKVLDLRSLNNKNFASVGGVSNKHLNDLEAKLLMDLRFDLFISQDQFVRYARRVMPASQQAPALYHAAFKQAHHSGTSSGHNSVGQSPRQRALTQVTFVGHPQTSPRRAASFHGGSPTSSPNPRSTEHSSSKDELRGGAGGD